MQRLEELVLVEQEEHLPGAGLGLGSLHEPGDLGGQVDMQLPVRGGEPGTWRWLRQPRGKGRILELGSETWAEIWQHRDLLIGQIT